MNAATIQPEPTYPPPPAVRRYLAMFFLTIALGVGAIAALLLYFKSRGELAPVPLTGSISFNAKMEFLRQRGQTNADVMAVGSSMVLNNLDTTTVLAHFPPGTSYVNTGAWGLKMSQTRELSEFLAPRLHPRTVVLVCGPMDFSRNDQVAMPFDHDELARFLAGEPYPLAIAKHLDLSYYWKQARLHAARKGYDSLAYDPGGGVLLDVSYPKIDPDRWNHSAASIDRNAGEYEALHALATTLRAQGIAFYVIQPPLRRAATSSPEAKAVLAGHDRDARSAMQPDEKSWINLQTELDFPDEEFADYSHLNAHGAKLFTEAAMRHIDALRSARPAPAP